MSLTRATTDQERPSPTAEAECFPPFPMSHQHNALGSLCLRHVKRQQDSAMYHGSLISLYLCLQIVTGTFNVQGPHEPVVAKLGGEAELPCFLLPSQNVKNMKISWTRFLPSQVVHLYEDERDKPEEAMDEYFERTELVTDYMYKGVVILRILHVQPSDSGQYHCAFQHGSFYNDTFIMLKVAALGSPPQLHMEVTESKQMQIVCKSEGWFPRPMVQWMDSEGREIPADSETHTQDKDGLFHVTTSLLCRETQKNLTCSVWNPILNQKKEGQLAPAVAASNSTILISTIIALATLTMLIILIPTGLYLCKKRKSLGVPCHDTGQTDTPTTTTAYDRIPECDPVKASVNDLRDAPSMAIDTTQDAASANPSQATPTEGMDVLNPDQDAAGANTLGTALPTQKLSIPPTPMPISSKYSHQKLAIRRRLRF